MPRVISPGRAKLDALVSGRLLIVNADDLGRTTGINAGVFEAHERGVVTSATLMVAYPAAEAAVRAAVRYPRLGIGLHLQLSGGRPLLPAADVPSLVDQAGLLPRRPDERLAAAAPAEVLAEARAQLERFRSLAGRLPTHLDSHHHAHRLPVVLEAVVALARENGLPVRGASKEVTDALREASIATTDFFVEEFYGEEASDSTLRRILGELPAGVTELMCHPGRVDAELRSSSAYSQDRERELGLLTADATRRLVRDLGIRLVHFGDLARAPGRA
jgi:predicted glycoside hydrolase/deacetylase ChbG (UPF0249 family)